jgi:predicted ATPase with chaperone activity
MNEHICEHCGATLRRPSPSRIDEVPGNEHVKRAVEVALAGGLSIGIIAYQGNLDYARALVSAAAGQGITAIAVPPCPCGNYADRRRACLCSVEAISAYQTMPAYRSALEADIVIEAPTIPVQKAVESRHWREADEVIFARAEEARARLAQIGDELDETGRGLLRAAFRVEHIAPTRKRVLLDIARAIVALAGEPSIRPAHLAEALQYQPVAPYRT